MALLPATIASGAPLPLTPQATALLTKLLRWPAPQVGKEGHIEN